MLPKPDFRLIDYQKAYHLFKTDKFDFLICMAAFSGVIFISMEMGILISVGIALVRALLYVARPASCKLGNISNSMPLYRDVEQYPGATGIPGMLLLQLGSPIYFANRSYLRDRILRYIRDDQDISNPEENNIEYVLLDLGGVTPIDTTGVEVLFEIQKNVESKRMKESVTKDYQNFKFQQLYQQAMYYCSLILQDQTWPWSDQLEALPHLEALPFLRTPKLGRRRGQAPGGAENICSKSSGDDQLIKQEEHEVGDV